MTERLRGSAAHSCSDSVPKTRSRTRPDGCWDWARLPTVMPLVRVERPESRSMVPASEPRHSIYMGSLSLNYIFGKFLSVLSSWAFFSAGAMMYV